jgi:polyprenyl-phospho-N-acetylgalactosaminyl synthase
MKTFVVIAAYNEEASVGGVVRDVKAHGYDVVVVDDGSTDSTAREARRATAVVLSSPINRGQGSALRTGIGYALEAGADVIVTYDADGQFVADEITSLIEPLQSGSADVALGSRYLDRTAVNLSAQKRLAHMLGRVWTWLFCGRWYSDPQCGLRAMNAQAARKINITIDRYTHASEILDEIARHHLRVREVPITVIYHRRGQSSLAAITIGVRMLIRKVVEW